MIANSTIATGVASGLSAIATPLVGIPVGILTGISLRAAEIALDMHATKDKYNKIIGDIGNMTLDELETFNKNNKVKIFGKNNVAKYYTGKRDTY